jgi:hypothetical protein
MHCTAIMGIGHPGNSLISRGQEVAAIKTS